MPDATADAAAGPLLRVADVSVHFGGLKALQGVSFSVERGEVFGIIGPNGAGKSTLLDVLSRLRRPASGSIVFDGHDLLARPAHRMPRLGIGRTFQLIEISPAASVLENVLAGAGIAYASNPLWTFLGDFKDRRQAARLRDTALGHLEQLDIAAFAGRPAGDVPYAVKKRLQVCRALMGCPKLLLLDEPGSGMDPTEKQLLGDCLQRIHRENRVTLVVIEHDVGFLSALCHRMLALEFGRVLAVGPVAEVTSSPAVVAAYLGTDA